MINRKTGRDGRSQNPGAALQSIALDEPPRAEARGGLPETP